MNTSPFKNPIANRISQFLHSIGIVVVATKVEGDTFLPGIRIVNGEIHADEEKMYPGDLLHEAGHLAVVPKQIRSTFNDNVVYDDTTAVGEEIGAIAWSWAALKHLNLPPEVLFHPDGYKGNSESFIENFSQGQFFGVPILQWKGLCIEKRLTNENTPQPYPHMIKWTVE